MSRKTLAFVFSVILVLSLAGASVARTHYCGLWSDKVANIDAMNAVFVSAGAASVHLTPPPRPWYW